MDSLVTIATFAAAVGCGLMAGTFFAFSSFLMGSLETRPVPERIATMQAINVKVLNISFLGTFLGTAVLCAGLAVHAAMTWEDAGAGARLAGGLLYVVGCFGVTGARNVPRNEELAKIDADGPDASATWQRFAPGWLFWNHVRTVACLAALAALM